MWSYQKLFYVLPPSLHSMHIHSFPLIYAAFICECVTAIYTAMHTAKNKMHFVRRSTRFFPHTHRMKSEKTYLFYIRTAVNSSGMVGQTSLRGFFLSYTVCWIISSSFKVCVAWAWYVDGLCEYFFFFWMLKAICWRLVVKRSVV